MKNGAATTVFQAKILTNIHKYPFSAKTLDKYPPTTFITAKILDKYPFLIKNLDKYLPTTILSQNPWQISLKRDHVLCRFVNLFCDNSSIYGSISTDCPYWEKDVDRPTSARLWIDILDNFLFNFNFPLFYQIYPNIWELPILFLLFWTFPKKAENRKLIN